HRTPHSFPTRRSSDLPQRRIEPPHERLALVHDEIRRAQVQTVNMVEEAAGRLPRLRKRTGGVDELLDVRRLKERLQVGVVHRSPDRKSTRLNSSHVKI